MKKLVIVLVAVGGLAVVGNASAKELGDRNTIAVTGGAFVQAQSAAPNSENTFIAANARIHWFFADGLSLFVGSQYGHQKSKYDEASSQSSHTVGGEVGVSGLVDLTEHVSLWPQLAFGVSLEKGSVSGVSYSTAADGSSVATPYGYDSSSTTYHATAQVPIIVKITKHTFASISFATLNYAKRTGDASGRSFNLSLDAGAGIGIGGWF